MSVLTDEEIQHLFDTSCGIKEESEVEQLTQALEQMKKQRDFARKLAIKKAGQRNVWRKKAEEIHAKVLRPLFEHYDSNGKTPIPSLLECERVIDNWPEE